MSMVQQPAPASPKPLAGAVRVLPAARPTPPPVSMPVNAQPSHFSETLQITPNKTIRDPTPLEIKVDLPPAPVPPPAPYQTAPAPAPYQPAPSVQLRYLP